MTKQEILEQIWPDSFVEENNLDKCIHLLRIVLREKPGERRYIETVRKHGYRFAAKVKWIKYVEPKTKSGRFAFPEEVRVVSLSDWGKLEAEQVLEPKSESTIVNESEIEIPKEQRTAHIPKRMLIAAAVGFGLVLIALYLYTS